MFRKLNIGHINICHLPNKVHDINILLNQDHKIDILGISESRLSDKISDQSIMIPNFSFYRKDPNSHGQTGIIVYVRNTITPLIQRREDLEHPNIECIWLEQKNSCNNNNINIQSTFICNLYRNGNVNYDKWNEDFSDMLQNVTRNNENIILLGDFNINLFAPHPKWKIVLDLFNLKQMIKTATRVASTSSTLIDHIYTNNENKISNPCVLTNAISDHYPIVCTLLFRAPKQSKKGHSTIDYRCFKNFNINEFLLDIRNIPYGEIYQTENPDEALEIFYNLFLKVINKFAPKRKRRVKNKDLPKWLNGDIISNMKIRDKYKKLKLFSEYKKQRNRVLTMVRSAQHKYYKNLLKHNPDLKTLWKVMNEITGINRKQNVGTDLTPNDFNDYFINLPHSIVQAFYSQHTGFQISPKLIEFCNDRIKNNESCRIPPISIDQTYKYIKLLKNKKSTGPDDLDTYLLKLTSPFIIPHITYIYNLCLSKNTFPLLFKTAKVIPIPKSKDQSNPNNFRPISLLNILSKPLERHIYMHIYSFLENLNLLYTFQSGFREKHSCYTALVRLVDSWLDNCNNKKHTGAVFLDLRKAFDLVNHSILLEKLSKYLKDDCTLALLKSYLSNREQYVYLNGSMSSTKPITCGVPQGSILGPLLFSIYINDLPLHISDNSCFLDLFADDSSLHSSNSSIPQLQISLQKSLSEIESWCNNNKMILHPDKCKSMLIDTRQKRQLSQQQPKLHLLIGNKGIESVTKHKLLGIFIDENLSFSSHIDHLCKIISKNLYLLSRLNPYLDSHSKLLFFYAHIMSYLNYSSSVWFSPSHSNKSQFNRLNSLHRRGVKLISDEKNISTDEKLYKLNILPLKDQLTVNLAMLTFKTMNDSCPDYMKTLLQKSNRADSINLIIPDTRIELFKKSFSFSATSLWNSLPKEIRLCNTIKTFKTKIIAYLKKK